ncbi:hypothetical protein [Croceibacterium xixiisoli]|nr:hypothetical protein [Croceibacterium xixiisoli]
MLLYGLEAGDLNADGEAVAEAMEARLRTGRPLATQDWIAWQEVELGGRLLPGKPGPRLKRA